MRYRRSQVIFEQSQKRLIPSKYTEKRISFGVYVIGVHFKYNSLFFAFHFVSSR